MKIEVKFSLSKEEFTTKEVSNLTWISLITIRKYINLWIIKWYRKWPRNFIVTKDELNNFLLSIGRSKVEDMEITTDNENIWLKRGEKVYKKGSSF